MADMTPEEMAEVKRVDAIYEAHALATGKANMAWNDVHAEIFLIFRDLSGLETPAAETLFYAVRADATQRDMTAALARYALQGRDALLAELLKVLNEVGKLAGQRNVAIHTSWVVRHGEEAPSLYMRWTKPKALEEDPAAQFKRLYGILVMICLHLQELRVRLPDLRGATTLLASLRTFPGLREAPAASPPEGTKTTRSAKPKRPPNPSAG